AASEMRPVAPRGPLERRDHDPAEQHHAGDHERVEPGERERCGERDQEHDLEHELRGPPLGHSRSGPPRSGWGSAAMPLSASTFGGIGVGAPVSGSNPLETFGNATIWRMSGSPTSRATNRSMPI